MTVLIKDPVGEYPLPIGSSEGIPPSPARVVEYKWYVGYGVNGVDFEPIRSYEYNPTDLPTQYILANFFPNGWLVEDVCISWPAHCPGVGGAPMWVFYEIRYATVPATSGSPSYPGYTNQTALSVYYNTGWNSWARSINSVQKGQYLEFTVDTAAVGSIVLFSYSGNEGQFGITVAGETDQGFFINSNDIYLINPGGAQTNFGVNTLGTRFFIYRLLDGRIAFRVGDYTHINAATLVSPYLPVYAYGMLFKAFDSITFAEIGTATVTEIMHTITLSGSSELRAATGTSALLSGSSRLLSVLTASAESTMTGTGYLLAEADALTRGTATLPLYISLGADYEYGFGNVSLPEYEQPQLMPEYAWAALPYYSNYAYGSDHDVGDGDASVPLYINLGADYEYGFGDGALPLHTSGATEGIDGEFVMFDVMRATATTTLAIDLILILNSSGTLESSFSMTREQALAFMSSVTGGDQYTFVGTFSMEMLTDLRGNSLQISTIGDAPDLQGNGVVWVVNLATRASSQYEDYGFNSFFNHNGQAYGVANDGIYSLGGDTDAGAYIPALVDLGKTNLGTPKVKYVPNVYMGISSTDKMVLKVIAGSRTYYYTARSSATEMRNQRFDIGKGLSANYWQLVLENSNGCDFELAEIEFTPITSSRRI